MKSYTVVNRSHKRVCLHRNSDICSIKPVNAGKRLREIDRAIMEEYARENIAEKANAYPGGINLPKKSDKPIVFDGKTHKTVPAHFGEELPECEAVEAKPLSHLNKIVFYDLL